MGRHSAFAFAFLLCAAVLPAPSQALPRAASVTLCGDQFLLMLADRGQITSLSWQSMAPLSFHAGEAAEFPQNHGSAEEMLLQGADVVVMNRSGNGQLRLVLDRFGVEVFELPLSDRIEEVEDTVLRLSAMLGREERGQALVAEMRARLDALSSQEREERPLTLYYRAGGGGAGSGTFVHSVMDAAGLRNMQAEIGHKGWMSLPLEQAVLDPPDAFVTSFFESPYNSVRNAFRHNPVFWQLAQDKPFYEVPGKFWPCASPLLVDAAEALAAQHGREWQ